MIKVRWLLLPALFLFLAGILITGCPSEPEPVEKVDNPNIIMKGGRYWHKFDQPRIQDGKEYIVTLRIDGCDADLPGSNMGGKLAFKINFDNEDEDDSILSGWADPVPVMILEEPGSYRWTFKAGEKNKDDKPIVSPATTPEGVTQFFYFEVQDSEWKPYPPSYEFGIRGEITVVEKIALTGTPTLVKVITLDYSDSSHDSAIGKGNIIDDNFTAVMNAKELGFLRFQITNCLVTEETREKGYAVGAVGNLENIGGSNPNASIKIPSSAALGSSVSFTADIFVNDFLYAVASGDSHIFINVFDSPDFGSPKNTKIELWTYPPQN